MERIRLITRNRKNSILIPIPAATRARNESRFNKLVDELSKNLNVENGFSAVTIIKDRAEFKGTRGQNKIYNLAFNDKQIKGKQVILIDYILSTGEGFIQIKHKLMELGATNVIGIFLAKTKKEGSTA